MMTLKEILSELESLGNERTRAHYSKSGAGSNQYGVKLGDIRKLAKKIKINQELALSLWETNNIDARFLAILIMEPTALSSKEMDKMVRSVGFVRVADWLNSYIVKFHPDQEALRIKWMEDDDAMAARAGWNLTKQRVVRNPEVLDLPMILSRLESEMGTAASEVQWTMNMALAEIGINFPEYRERALAIGENLGIYRDYPVSKGCTSPFAPLWIKEMVSRQTKS